MKLVQYRCSLTGETQSEVLCSACFEELAPTENVSEADPDAECTTCSRARGGVARLVAEWQNLGSCSLPVLFGLAIARSGMKLEAWDALARETFEGDSTGEQEFLEAYEHAARARLSCWFACGDCLHVVERTQGETARWWQMFDEINHGRTTFRKPEPCPECGGEEFDPCNEPEARAPALAARGLRTVVERVAACRRLGVLLRDDAGDGSDIDARIALRRRALDLGAQLERRASSAPPPPDEDSERPPCPECRTPMARFAGPTTSDQGFACVVCEADA